MVTLGANSELKTAAQKALSWAMNLVVSEWKWDSQKVDSTDAQLAELRVHLMVDRKDFLLADKTAVQTVVQMAALLAVH